MTHAAREAPCSRPFDVLHALAKGCDSPAAICRAHAGVDHALIPEFARALRSDLPRGFGTERRLELVDQALADRGTSIVAHLRLR
jgi:hypothetical protein